MPKATKLIQKPSSGISQTSQKSVKPSKAIAAKTVNKVTKKAPIVVQKNKKVVPQVPIKAASKKITKVDSKKQTQAPTFKKVEDKPKGAQPKKPSSPYNIFTKQMHAQMTQNKKFKDLPMGDKTRVISESWSKLKDAQRQQYVDLAKQDQKRYNKEVKQLEAKGFFINQDGKKSNETKKAKTTVKVAAKAKAAEKKKAEKKPDVTMPRKPISAYMHFNAINVKQTKAKDPNLKMTDISKQSGQKWSKMTDKEKEPYVKLNEQSKALYEKEMKQFNELGYYVNSEGIKSTYLNKKHVAQEFEYGTVMPKKVKGAYMFFNAEALKARKPDQSITALGKASGEQWSKMSDKEKQKYVDLQNKDSKRFDKEMADLRSKGYFTNADNVKSTELKFKAPKVPKRKASPAKKVEVDK